MHHFIRSPTPGPPTKVAWTSRVLAITPLLCAALALPAQTSPDVPTPAQAAPAPAASFTPGSASTPFVQAIPDVGNRPLNANQPLASADRKAHTYTVDGTQWLDSGLLVTGGEQVIFSASGSLTLSDGRSVSASGLDRGWKDLLRQFPLNSANTGSLIGRVSDATATVPFAIGASATVSMPSSGHLYLRANLSDDLPPTGGTFRVSVRPVAATASSTPSAQPATSATPVATLVAPSLFANIPRRVADQAGGPGDMVNFAIVGTQPEVEAAFRNAGWVAVDKNTQTAVLHGLLSTLSHQAYTEMPMSTLFLFGRPQDLSFARADPLTVAAERHHLRVWKTDQIVAGSPLWVGSATHDIGFERDQRNGGTTHKIDPAIDNERTFLLDSFNAAGNLSSAAYLLPADPLREAHTATGGSFNSDGRIVVMDLVPNLK